MIFNPMVVEVVQGGGGEGTTEPAEGNYRNAITTAGSGLVIFDRAGVHQIAGTATTTKISGILVGDIIAVYAYRRTNVPALVTRYVTLIDSLTLGGGTPTATRTLYAVYQVTGPSFSINYSDGNDQ